jgi:amino acid transporter
MAQDAGGTAGRSTLAAGGGRPPDASGFYARKATGLVRGISMRDSLVMNVAFINIALGALSFTVAPYAFPGVNLWLSVLLTVLLTLFPTVMYAMLSATMPRSGGDYVFVSRIIHPAVGFVANFNTTAWMTFFTGILASWVSGFAASSALLTMGTVLESQTLIDWSSTAASKNWQFGVGLLTIAVFTVLVSMGTRATFRALGIIFGLMVLCQLVALAVLAFHSHADFVSAYGNYASYSDTMATAKRDQFTFPSGLHLDQSLAAMPLIFSSLGYGIVSCYCSGEVKQASRTSMYSMVGAVAFGGLVIGLFGALSMHVFGSEFLAGIQGLSTTDDYPLAAPPFFYLFVSMLTTNSLVVGVIAIGFVLAIIANIPPMFMVATRNILAWGFDRIIPMRLAEVHPRFAAPVNATVVTGLFMAGCMTYFIYVPSKWTAFIFTAGIGSLLTFFTVAICGLVFPWRRPDIYASSPYNRSLLGVPLISAISAVSAAFDALLIYYLWTNSALGANSTQGKWALLAFIAVPLAIYLVATFVNKRRGLDLAAAQTELPPE